MMNDEVIAPCADELRPGAEREGACPPAAGSDIPEVPGSEGREAGDPAEGERLERQESDRFQGGPEFPSPPRPKESALPRIRVHCDSQYRFLSFFNPATGAYFRTGVLDQGRDTGIDPFMASFPELLDVGIMGHCAHGLSGLCARSGVECYQMGGGVSQPHMALDDFAHIARQCEARTFQFALGGRGDPDMHPHFPEILEICRQHRIVPNFTTSGFGLTGDKAALCRQYCGAVAVSWYRSAFTLRAIDMLLQAGVKTSIHFVLSRSTIREAISLLEEAGFPRGVNAVVFLLHKPVGSGSRANVLQKDDPEVEEFFRTADRGGFPWKIGFDSCSIPGLLTFTRSIAPESLDTCEGARWSAYITPDMQMLPCSFDSAALRWAVDLRSHSIEEAWNTREFQDFRQHFRTSCPHCPKRSACMGGCPIVPEVVLCGDQAAGRVTE